MQKNYRVSKGNNMLSIGLTLIILGIIIIVIYAFTLTQIDVDEKQIKVATKKKLETLEKNIYENVYVKYVHDGDSITVTLNNITYEVRLAYIDAPEYNSKSPKERNQPYGYEAQNLVWQYIFQRWDRRVNLKVLDATDYYKRSIAEVYPPSNVGRGQSLNYELVQRGLAWYYRQYKPTAENLQKTYSNAENEARVQKLGLWIHDDPQAPWNFRKQ